jgi:hypothetical protein
VDASCPGEIVVTAWHPPKARHLNHRDVHRNCGRALGHNLVGSNGPVGLPGPQPVWGHHLLLDGGHRHASRRGATEAEKEAYEAKLSPSGRDGLVAADHLRHHGLTDLYGPPASRGDGQRALKGAFTDLGRGFIRVIGVTKMTVMLGFTLAAHNLNRIRSFRAKLALDETGHPTDKPKQTRARRRTGAWAEVIDTNDPPPM